MIGELIKYASELIPDVAFRAGDATRAEPGILAAAAKAAKEAGASLFVICDDSGETLPAETAACVKAAAEAAPGLEIGIAVEGLDGAGEDQLHVGALPDAVLVDPGAPEFVAPVDKVQLGDDLREVERLLEGGVAAADHGDGLAAEEVAVADGAVGHAAAAQPVLALQPELAVPGAAGDDDGFRAHGAGGGRQLEGAGLAGNAGHVGRRARQVEAVEMGVEGVGEFPALDALGEAGIVLHGVGQEHLAAGRQLLEEDDRTAGADQIQGGGDARRSGADDGCVEGVHAAASRRGPWTRAAGRSGPWEGRQCAARRLRRS